jgi:polyisoprenoid-binding protein YceI
LGKRNIIIGVVGAVIVFIGAVWFFFLRSDAPPPATLESAVAEVTGESTTTTEAAATDDGAPTETTAAPTTTTPESTTAAPSGAGLDGAWTVDTGVSFVGYRIEEDLASIGSVTAVGRTKEIEASLTFAGSMVTELSVSVAMATLESDRSRRDDAMASRGLETNSFPTATFVLSEPIELDAVPAEGEAINATATGELTLHGVTQSIALDLEGSLVEGTMVVVGSTEILLADYAIEKPTGFSVLDISDTGTLEIQLAFVRG